MKKKKLNSKNPKYYPKPPNNVAKKVNIGKKGTIAENKVFAVYKLNEMEKITKEQFEAYVDVQMSGVTNMFDVKLVGELSGLEKEQIMKIMVDYGTLKDKYDE